MIQILPCGYLTPKHTTTKMPTFQEAKDKAIKEIASEPADNGFHYAVIQYKKKWATDMTEESMHEILKTKSKPSLTEESFKHGVASLIRSYMKKI